MKPIYLDNSSIAKPSTRAVSAMLPYCSELWGAVHVPHRYGQRLMPQVRDSYARIYKYFGAEASDTFILTSSGGEAINQLFWSVSHYHQHKATQRKQYITSSLEEAAPLMCISRLEEEGCQGLMAEPNALGIITAGAITALLTDKTALVSLSLANGLLGTINEISSIAEQCHRQGALLHVDVSYGLGKLDVHMKDLQADYITFSGEPLHVPGRVGGLIAGHGRPLIPLLVGGLEQAGLRAGALDVCGLVALTEALKELEESKDYVSMETARLRNKLEEGVAAAVEQVKFFFQGQERLPNISVMAFPGCANEAMLYLLDREGLAATIGGGNFQQLALLLGSCAVDEVTALSALSFSLSRDTTEEEIDNAIGLIGRCAKQLESYSTVQ